ncbi:MAG TPA: FadR/GntR family transcriptional regulator [Sphaerochaeta sp.]|jgi:DNA-binding FadR family transcriptional regulator|nr:FadR/GntR family transcriptional regulator [Sphaerochaeta sp.]
MKKQALLPSTIALEIKKLIIDQNLPPGTKLLNETEMINLYGVSRPTLREAIKILIAENVVEIRRGKGTFVTQNLGIGKDPLGLNFSNQKHLIRNLFETRLLIEPPIARLAAVRRTKAGLESLKASLDAFSNVFEKGESHADYDVAFHSNIARCSNNDVLFRILPIIIETIKKGSFETYEVEESNKRAMVFHTNLFAAIENQNPSLAENLMQKHIIEAAADAKIDLTINWEKITLSQTME